MSAFLPILQHASHMKIVDRACLIIARAHYMEKGGRQGTDNPGAVTSRVTANSYLLPLRSYVKHVMKNIGKNWNYLFAISDNRTARFKCFKND